MPTLIIDEADMTSLRSLTKEHGRLGWRRLSNLSGLPRRIVRKYITITDAESADPAFAEQESRDLSRIQEAEFRATARQDNRYTALLGAMLTEIKSVDMSRFQMTHEVNKKAPVGLVQISDTHFNELVELVGNTYDFPIASQRLKLLADKTIMYFKGLGVTELVVVGTGDLVNSDRRLDEMLNKATNRAKACMLAVHLLKQFLLHLSQNFNVQVALVCGNESRINKEHGHSNDLITDNYDWIIGETLRMVLEGTSIEFITHDPAEAIIQVNGQNVLCIHGDQIPNSPTTKIQQIVGKWAGKGIIIDYVIFGHIHMAFASDNFSRSASLVGDNAYSSVKLQLIGRASQNGYLFYECGNRDAIKFDLQNTKAGNAYHIHDKLIAYNAKSAQKEGAGSRVTVIHKTVI